MSIIEKAVKRLTPEGQDGRVHRGPNLAGEAFPTFSTAPARPVENSVALDPSPSTVDVGASQTMPELQSRGAQGQSAYVEISFDRLRSAGFISPDNINGRVSEEFRIVKRPLLTNAFGKGAKAVKNGNLIMVTSSLPGEGKTFSAINLAISIAMERDHRVLLVDADVAKPSVPAALGIPGEKGLLDLVLERDLQFSDVLIKTNIDKLNILPAGRKHSNATELLASEAMHRLLQEISQRYHDRIIIFDSPPLLATTEARALASRMGQIVMVVEAGKTQREALKEALTQIVNCEVVGLLLNKGGSVLGGDESYGYGYGTYGGYGA